MAGQAFSVSAHVNRPGNYEVPLGTAFSTLLENGRWHARGRKPENLHTGVSSAPVVPATTMMDCYHGLRLDQQGRFHCLGQAVIVMDGTTTMVKALERLSFF